ncbi:MAG: DEAD/DEAH box helicase [Ruthenibacterium sp.]
MTDVLFSALGLSENLAEGVAAMGFEHATPVQAQTIPIIRTGVDVIARSQTGTGKTVAFAVPALERIDTAEGKPTVQVLILCPTRELAQQAGDEFRKLAKFMPGIYPAEVYGGADMSRQFIQLRRANLVIGTPGRVMDHMRRKTLKLDHIKMLILDEADEMLNMGFKEDIETILLDTPADRQTLLFSATMPAPIRALAGQFLHEPQMVEIDKSQVTLQRIEQSFVEVALPQKAAALSLLLRYYRPNRALVFCNTKRMVDELTARLNQDGFSAESIHGDLNQGQRTSVMNNFKRGKISILIATDVAARGIDVNDLDYVFNYDIPTHTEYYVHRIGRTGRAGKSGCAITLCSGRRQVQMLRNVAREAKSEIRQSSLPTAADIMMRETERNLASVEAVLAGDEDKRCVDMVSALMEKGHTPERIAAAVLQLQFPELELSNTIIPTGTIQPERYDDRPRGRHDSRDSSHFTPYTDIVFDIGSANRVAPNHLVGAITERADLTGKEIGKIQISPEQSVVGIPSDRVDAVLAAMLGCKICGKPAHSMRLAEPSEGRKARPYKAGPHGAPRFGKRPGEAVHRKHK